MDDIFLIFKTPCVNISPSLQRGHLAFNTLDKTDTFSCFTVFVPKKNYYKYDDIGSEEKKHDTVV